MLETILRLYTAFQAEQVRTPIVHLFGPPGCGKSTFVEQAAKLLGVNLHIINVSRISPLELEGVQMPMEGKLDLLLATYWNKLEDGDIVLLDEFLRGFPEVYNGLLDILTSRRVGGHTLANVFFIAASNSTSTYDWALEDRLLHLRMPDPRHNKIARANIAKIISKALHLLPLMEVSGEMDSLIGAVIEPMYSIFDKKNMVSSNSSDAMSPRKIIGQAQLRLIECKPLELLLNANNARAMAQGTPQYVKIFFTNNGARMCQVPPSYVERISAMVKSKVLPPDLQKQALMNLQLIQANNINRKEQGDDDVFVS